jgi:hypothetical protein
MHAAHVTHGRRSHVVGGATSTDWAPGGLGAWVLAAGARCAGRRPCTRHWCWHWCWSLVLVTGPGTGHWCWHGCWSLVLVTGARHWCSSLVLVLVLVTGAGHWAPSLHSSTGVTRAANGAHACGGTSMMLRNDARPCDHARAVGVARCYLMSCCVAHWIAAVCSVLSCLW